LCIFFDDFAHGVMLVIPGWQSTRHPGEIWPRNACTWFVVSQETVRCILSG